MLLCILSGNLYAQNHPHTVGGNVKDENNQPIPYASVALLSLVDSSIVKMAMADSAGHFLFTDVARGNYLLVAKMIGYTDNKDTKVAYLDENSPLILDNILLAQERKTIKEVVVTSRKPVIEVKPDRTVINVAGTINASGTSAFELLRKSPGIRIMNEDDIQINGKKGMLVYLDGTLVNLSGKELSDLLKHIQSSNVATIEIITNPSAKYDAAGNAGIISIKTKKDVNVGWNGTVSLTTNFGRYMPKYDAGASLNYRSKKVNVYGNYNFANSNNRTSLEYLRQQADVNGENTHFDQYFTNLVHNRIHNFKAGADFFATKNSRFSLMMDGNIADYSANSNSTTSIYHTGRDLDSQLIANNNQTKNSKLFSYTGSYGYSDSLGRELNIDGSYMTYNMDGTGFQPNYYENAKGEVTSSNIYSNTSGTKIKVASGKADYSQKLASGVLSLGAKINYVQANNRLDYYDVFESATVRDTGRTNQFTYHEKVIAGYIDYRIKVLSKLSIAAGLRTEHTQVDGQLNTLTANKVQSVDSQYINFFPNLALAFSLDRNNEIGLIYNKRIDRPAYQDLNPFEFVLDELSYVKGNPFLKPQLSQTVKLSHIYKQMLTTSISYTDTRDYIVRYRDTITAGRTFQTNTNLAHLYTLNLSATFQYSPAPWWDFNYTLSGYRQQVKGRAGQTDMDLSQNTWSASGNNTFRYNKWSLEIIGFYNSRFLDAPALVNSQWTVDAGIQRKILKDAGTLRLSVSDIFNSLEFSLKRDFGGLYYVNRNKWETQQVKIAFSYRFGNQKIKGPSNRDNGLNDQKRRMR
ncbi:outer membrane beta-barrel protein [Chitinophaga sp. LS1]|uniref:outer membrane beta-barrel protein n=1 Tax=Chitinophaga sp. LS1 TaxID=3051176 RepID=UPI002AABE6B0|nr:outer membrane beta-barrel protein [Chitinophaga sp. LS1]WPV66542.1 TonB-dependent receptor [Chitinophaga sp. LS1]